MLYTYITSWQDTALKSKAHDDIYIISWQYTALKHCINVYVYLCEHYHNLIRFNKYSNIILYTHRTLLINFCHVHEQYKRYIKTSYIPGK